jgi:glycerophosphoryl diester phosphodiesterase
VPTAAVRRTHTQENTVLSFNMAAAFGAEYVEFDVQVYIFLCMRSYTQCP